MRCFAHVHDAVEAVVPLIDCPAAVGHVFNVGTDEEIAIRELAERVRACAGSSSPIERIPYDEAYAEGFEDTLRRVTDVGKLERVTGFRPRIPLTRMIEDVLEDRRARLASGRPGRA